jgi:hypothetical protein
MTRAGPLTVDAKAVWHERIASIAGLFGAATVLCRRCGQNVAEAS